MIKIYAIDRTPEARIKLKGKLDQLIPELARALPIMPEITIEQKGIEELNFQSLPTLAIIGDQLATTDMRALSSVVKKLEGVPSLVVLPPTHCSIEVIERYARIGVSDYISTSTTAEELIKRIIILLRAIPKKQTELLLVDSAKGGIGNTTMTCALAEALLIAGKTVCVVDCDVDNRDLTTFLGVRPYINENLDRIICGEIPITAEQCEHARAQVWQDVEGFYCVAPPARAELLFSDEVEHALNLNTFLQVTGQSFDVVIADTAKVRGVMLESLIVAADKVLVCASNDPSSIYTTTSRIEMISHKLSKSAELMVSVRECGHKGLTTANLQSLVNEHLEGSVHEWTKEVVPFCKQGANWPRSGSTFYGLAQNKVKNAIGSVITELGYVDMATANKAGLFGRLFGKNRASEERVIAEPRRTLDAPRYLPLKEDLPNRKPLLGEPAKVKQAKKPDREKLNGSCLVQMPGRVQLNEVVN